ncbi:NifB/NifX family molybdenum-iron cluster-binding protein [Candidatus Omnitrophota bacterium]
MKICVTSQGENLEAQVDPRFGRCQYFIVVETDSMTFEAVKNPNTEAMGGAGIQSSQLMAEKGIKAVLSGNVGPNAFQTLQAAGIKVFTGVSGNVKEAVEKYEKGGFTASDAPSVGSKFGMQGGSMGRGGRGRRGQQ